MDDIKDNSTEKKPLAKEQSHMKSTIQSSKTIISSTSATKKHSDNSEQPLLQTSTKSEKLHPWCKLTRRLDDIKDNPTEKKPLAQEQSHMKSTIQSSKTHISSTSATKKHSDNSEQPLLQTSTKSEKLHPWCKLTRRSDDIKDNPTEKIPLTKEQSSRKSTIQSSKTLISSTSATKKHSNNRELPLLQTSKSNSENNVEIGTKQTRECDITSKKDETVRQQVDGNTSDNKSSLPSTHTAVPKMKTNIKYTK